MKNDNTYSVGIHLNNETPRYNRVVEIQSVTGTVALRLDNSVTVFGTPDQLRKLLTESLDAVNAIG